MFPGKGAERQPFTSGLTQQGGTGAHAREIPFSCVFVGGLRRHQELRGPRTDRLSAHPGGVVSLTRCTLPALPGGSAAPPRL